MPILCAQLLRAKGYSTLDFTHTELYQAGQRHQQGIAIRRAGGTSCMQGINDGMVWYAIIWYGQLEKHKQLTQ